MRMNLHNENGQRRRQQTEEDDTEIEYCSAFFGCYAIYYSLDKNKIQPTSSLYA